jgi:mono/diheme cytochrome c family protein/glucose/arabinose dehydrogenase
MSRRFQRASAGSIAVFAMVAATSVAPPSRAQQGDNPGETQPDVPSEWLDFESRVLSPAQAIGAFIVEPGFRIDLVAGEPLIESPVEIEFDERGRAWVVEMRGFMPNADGIGEQQPIGRISILSDDDGDGVYDASTVFLDHLTLPRAIGLAHGGALVVDPPDLIFARDDDGDDRADTILHLATGLGGLASPEHAANGLLRAIDNRFHLSQHPFRFVFDGEQAELERTPGHGQWGLTADDVGRLFYTTNSDPLRADLIPCHYASRNPRLPSMPRVNERVVHDFRVWPARLTPGINRGYQRDMLKDGRLVNFTAACGPAINRGHLFSANFLGDAFICEPAGNLVKRVIIQEPDAGRLEGGPAVEGREFLASIDERFRPVNAAFGPDGALYIVDMYRGVIQHRIFMTSFLRRQVVARGLDRPTNCGRIYRIAPDHAPPHTLPDVSGVPSVDLAASLRHADGWQRDLIQRLLIERRAFECVDTLRATLRDEHATPPRLHALWTLQGLGVIELADLEVAAADPDPWLRVHALRVFETFDFNEGIHNLVEAALHDPDSRVRRQAALSLSAWDEALADELRLDVIAALADDALIRAAIAAGAAGREIDMLDRLSRDAAFGEPRPGLGAMIELLVDCVLRSADGESIAHLCEIASGVHELRTWQAEAMLARLARLQRAESDRPKPLHAAREPNGWRDLTQAAGGVGHNARLVDKVLHWPGRAGALGSPRELTAAERVAFDLGSRLYVATCATCHLPSGHGQDGVAPSLVDSARVLGDDEALIKILLHGMSGPVEVNGRTFNGEMPRAAFGTDPQIAAILTYIRRSWGNNADPVSPDRVAGIRSDTWSRAEPWRVDELD